HRGKVLYGQFDVGDTVTARVDTDRRDAIRRAHSATHLLQSALRETLGDHVHQSGSLVEPDKLRFDFTHTEPLTAQQLENVERLVNSWVLAGEPITVAEKSIEQAKAAGATALFGEKYGDKVRVVTMGGASGDVSGNISKELCGGTHLDNTSKVGAFHITAEFSVASGVRRVEAVTGLNTLQLLHRAEIRLADAGALVKANTPDEIPTRVAQLQAELSELRRAVEASVAKAASGVADKLASAAVTFGALRVVAETVAGDADTLRQIGDRLRELDENAVALLVSNDGGKSTFFATCGKGAVTAGVRAGDLVKAATKVVGGSGGGKPDSAMGGGKVVADFEPVAQAAYSYVKGAIKL
ncbi:MAG: alanine--tRNA ligase, partial [Oscillospiraceae bacterium]|nr:alanine--tRNA ligase [Oscillospiraceae bacterium]